MNRLPLIALLVFGISAVAFAQTKKIAHKSHSGSAASFMTALKSDLFDLDCSNFGMAPTRLVKKAQLDSVIFLSEHKAIMVTSEYCFDRIEKTNTLWQPGKDTVTDHPLFSKQHALDSIRENLHKYYYFRNSMDSVKFIGYDNKKTTTTPPSSSQQKPGKGYFLPLHKSDDTQPPSGHLLFFYAGLLLTTCVFAGLFSWNYRQT